MKNCIGIRRENKYPTERRAPLTPGQVQKLVDNYHIRVLIEPNQRRIFREDEYRAAGAEITADLSDCNVIFGVKEIPLPDLHPDQTYCFFSHTIKAQPHNMPMLKHITEQRISLLDYELVTNRQGRRQIFFGNFAGYAGMIDSLWALGQRLAAEGIDTPFLEIQPVNQYDSLDAAMDAVKHVGNHIRTRGLPEALSPLICGFSGYGQVSKAAQKIFELLPMLKLSPSELGDFVERGQFSNHTLYSVEFYEKDMFEPRDAGAAFDLPDYFAHPEKYRSKFEQYIPHLTLLINGIFWTPQCPRLVTKAYLKTLFRQSGQPRLRVLGDISCDIEGSIEATVKATKSDNPVYVYDPETDTARDGVSGRGPVVMAIDILPAELPREATEFFGNALMFYIPALAAADFSQSTGEINLPADFQKALIVHNGQLTPGFRYLEGHF